MLSLLSVCPFVISLIVAKVRLRPLKCTSFIMHTAVSMLNSILIHKAISICLRGVIILSKGSICYIHNIIIYEKPTRFILLLCILVIIRIGSSYEYEQKWQ
jgi:hypothetical protein